MIEKRTLTTDRLLTFCRAVCNAWSGEHGNCVMDEPDKLPCDAKNCFIYPIAVEALAKLDVHAIFEKKTP